MDFGPTQFNYITGEISQRGKRRAGMLEMPGKYREMYIYPDRQRNVHLSEKDREMYIFLDI